MGVYIKGMEMPKSCPCELLGVGCDLCCSFAGGIPARVKEYYECCQNDTRPSWCPLVHVQAHGRLIDADELMAKIEHDTPLSDVYEKTMRRYLHNAPTIIPIEEGE